jgi:hypothetical protein
MAIDTYLVGNDGNVTISVGGTTSSIMKVNSFTLGLNRAVSVLTGFGDTGGRRRLGMLDASGTLNGFAGVDSTAATTTASSTLFINQFNAAATNVTNSIPEVSLTLFDASTTNDAKLVTKAVLYNWSFNSTKTGDSTLSCNFDNADGAAPVLTWLV